jgi:hypothetical protein
MFFLSERPCLALAAGLSRATRTEDTYTMPDRTEYLVDWSGGKVATAARRFKGKTVNLWTYSGSIPAAGANFSVPARSQLKIDLSNQQITRTYIVRSISLNPPADSELSEPWIEAGTEVVDERVQPPVTWSYEELQAQARRLGGLTPKQLLALSERRSSSFALADAAKRRSAEYKERQTGRTLMVFVALFVSLLVLLVGGYLIVSRILANRKT